MESDTAAAAPTHEDGDDRANLESGDKVDDAQPPSLEVAQPVVDAEGDVEMQTLGGQFPAAPADTDGHDSLGIGNMSIAVAPGKESEEVDVENGLSLDPDDEIDYGDDDIVMGEGTKG